MSGRILNQFFQWLLDHDIKVMVWDMDHTMSEGHCGVGIERTKLEEYTRAVSLDFVELLTLLGEHEQLSQIKFAVATNSDPLEYLEHAEGDSTHILGPDLATSLLQSVQLEDKFPLKIGYDYRLHGSALEEKGKRYHMRKIQEHYKVPFSSILFIDDSPQNLINEDGWIGMLSSRSSDLSCFSFADVDAFLNKSRSE